MNHFAPVELLRRPVAVARGPVRGISRTQYSWPYELFFEYLQLSPSYRLAHRIAIGELDRAEVKPPRDFAVVERTYRAFGSVFYVDFMDWWEETAQHRFGRNAELEATVIAAAAQRAPVTEQQAADAAERVARFLVADRAKAGNPATLILALPNYGDRSAVLRAVAELLDDVNGLPDEPGIYAPFRLGPSKMGFDELLRALQLVWLWAGVRSLGPQGRPRKNGAASPSVQGGGHAAKHGVPVSWIASRLGFSPSHKLREKGADGTMKRVKASADRLNTLAGNTRAYAYRIAEWAARGRFPCADALDPDPARPTFDRQQLHALIRSHRRFDYEQSRRWMQERHPGFKGKLSDVADGPVISVGPKERGPRWRSVGYEHDD